MLLTKNMKITEQNNSNVRNPKHHNPKFALISYKDGNTTEMVNLVNFLEIWVQAPAAAVFGHRLSCSYLHYLFIKWDCSSSLTVWLHWSHFYCSCLVSSCSVFVRWILRFFFFNDSSCESWKHYHPSTVLYMSSLFFFLGNLHHCYTVEAFFSHLFMRHTSQIDQVKWSKLILLPHQFMSMSM